MNIRDYFNDLKRIIDRCGVLGSYHLTFDERSNEIGFITGILYFPDNIELHFREFIDVALNHKYKYAYHVMKKGKIQFRYDNSNDIQARKLKTHPHHKHLPDGSIVESGEIDLEGVLREIEDLF